MFVHFQVNIKSKTKRQLRPRSRSVGSTRHGAFCAAAGPGILVHDRLILASSPPQLCHPASKGDGVDEVLAIDDEPFDSLEPLGAEAKTSETTDDRKDEDLCDKDSC